MTITEMPATIAEDYEEDVITYSDIPPLPRIPVWPKHLYRGTVTLVAGAGGCGKGMMGVHCAAVVTRGGLFPGEAEDTTRDRTPGSVVGVWPEDDPNEDMAWRLSAALAGEGADLSLVYDLTETEDGDPFDLHDGGLESIERMQHLIERLSHCTGTLPCGCGRNHPKPQRPVRLVVIDPLLAVADTLNTNKQARKTMRPLMRMAKETGVAVLVTHHTVKDGKVASSKGLTDVLRLVFTARHDVKEDGVMVLAVEKSNNLGTIPNMRYKIGGTGQSPYIEWIEDVQAKRSRPSWRQQQGRQVRQEIPTQDWLSRTLITPSVNGEHAPSALA